MVALTDELAQEAVSLLKEEGTVAGVARRLNLSRSTVQNRLQRATERGLDGSIPQKAAFGRKIVGVSTLYREDGTKAAQWVKEKNEPSLEETTQTIKEAFADFDHRSEPQPFDSLSDKDLLTVFPMVDHHHGMLSWGDETGEDYDMEISSKRLRETFSFLLTQGPASAEALILNLGDWFHINDSKNMTPHSGNLLDVDSRFPKVVRTGVLLMIECIEMALKKHELVTVRNLPGNHDRDAIVAMNVALELYYQDHPRVKIDTTPSEFFFMRFGQNLIMGNHGHRLKPTDMVLKLANERPKDWGDTKYRWCLYGHYHHDQMKEIGGVRVESFQTLASKDAHAANGGYLSGKSMNSITLHRERGEIGRIKVNL